MQSLGLLIVVNSLILMDKLTFHHWKYMYKHINSSQRKFKLPCPVERNFKLNVEIYNWSDDLLASLQA